MSELPFRAVGSLNAGLVNISRDTRPITEEEKILTIAILSQEVGEQVSKVRGMHDSLVSLLGEASRMKEENNDLASQAIEEIRYLRREVAQAKKGQEILGVQLSESVGLIFTNLSDIQTYQQRTFWRRVKDWIIRGRSA